MKKKSIHSAEKKGLHSAWGRRILSVWTINHAGRVCQNSVRSRYRPLVGLYAHGPVTFIHRVCGKLGKVSVSVLISSLRVQVPVRRTSTTLNNIGPENRYLWPSWSTIKRIFNGFKTYSKYKMFHHQNGPEHDILPWLYFFLWGTTWFWFTKG